jgi:RND family efflux transporter MFP subunit
MATLKDDLASLKISHDARAGGGRRGVLVLVGLVLLLAVAGGGWFWSQQLQAAAVKTASVTSQTGAGATPGAILNGSGYVTARRRATVSSKVTGKVLEVYVEEGKEVRRGQVLARLDDSQIRAGLDVARAQVAAARGAAAEDEARLREAQLTQQRLQKLVDEKVVSRAEVDTAEATVKSLDARIALARQQVQVAERQVAAQETDLADMTVRAPFDGVAISKDAQPGEMISPVSAGGGFTRTGICTIVDMSSLEIEVDVSESYINRVRPNQPVEAVLDAYPDWRIPAHVITTVPSADRQKATVRVRMGFDKLDPRILPDMGVKVSVFNDKPAEPSATPRARLLVPKAAVRSVGGQQVVFVVRDERVERRAVTIGTAEGDQVEVVSGVAAGDKVVVEGPDTLTDGARVKER